MAAEAAKLLGGSACARHLGIPASTFNENRRAGVIADPTRVRRPRPPLCQRRRSETDCGDRATRDAREGPRGARRRAPHAASAGLTEATPFAEPAHAVARGVARRRQPPVPPAGRILRPDHHRRWPESVIPRPSATRRPASGAPSSASASPRRSPQAAPSTPCATKGTVGGARRPTLAVDGHVKVYAGRNSAAETLRRAGLRELLDQRPRRSPPAVPAQSARPEAGQGARARCPTWWNWAWCRKRPPT